MARPRAIPFACAPLLVALSACGGGGGGGGGGDDLSNLDQDFTPSSITFFAGVSSGSPTEQAMTFPVGRTGLLTRIDFMLIAGGDTADDDVEFELRPTIAGVPDPSDASVLVAGVLSSSDWPSGAPGLVALDVSSAALTVSVGEVYALVLRSVHPTSGGSWAGSSDTAAYSGGDGYYRETSVSSDFVLIGGDFAFRTHVE
jgi:hypothetical protein